MEKQRRIALGSHGASCLFSIITGSTVHKLVELKNKNKKNVVLALEKQATKVLVFLKH